MSYKFLANVFGNYDPNNLTVVTVFTIGCDEDSVKEETKVSDCLKLNLFCNVALLCLKCDNVFVSLVSAQLCVLLMKYFSLYCSFPLTCR